MHACSRTAPTGRSRPPPKAEILCALAQCLCWLLLCATGVASAHPAPYSYIDVYLDDAGLRGTLTLHDFDAAHELGIAQPDSLLDPATARAQRDRLVQVLQPRLHWQADGQSLSQQWGDTAVLADRQSLRLPFDLGAARPGRIELQTVLFPYDAQHLSFVNIYEAGRLRQQAILDAGHATVVYYSGSAQGHWAVVRTFVASGFHHILIGPDHILFLLGLLLLGGSLRRLIAIVTAFTVGHSVTLSLAALGLVQIAPRLIEPAIALSIVIVGLDNLLSRTATQRDLRPWLAGIFGLLHGFGFAAVLLQFGLPRSQLGWSLASFNIGVEIGQLAIVLAMAVLLALVRRYNAAIAGRIAVFGSLGVMFAGVYWFIQRVWGGIT